MPYFGSWQVSPNVLKKQKKTYILFANGETPSSLSGFPNGCCESVGLHGMDDGGGKFG